MANLFKKSVSDLSFDEMKNIMTTDVNDLRRRAKAAKGEDMSKRITESSYAGENVKSDKKATPKSGPKPSKKEESMPSGNIGSASGEIGPDMGKVNKAVEDSNIDYSGLSRTASDEDTKTKAKEDRVDMHEQARRMMGFKKGGAVRRKSSGCGMKAGGAVKSSASRRGDGCAIRGKTKGRMI